MSQANRETISRFVNEVINKKNLTVIDEIIHPNYVYRTPDQELHGRQALGQLFTDYQTALPDLHVNIDDLVCTNDRAVLLFTLTGTHEKDFMGIPVTCKQVNVNGITCSRFENGQIIEEWELLDQLSMFRQLDIVSI